MYYNLKLIKVLHVEKRNAHVDSREYIRVTFQGTVYKPILSDKKEPSLPLQKEIIKTTMSPNQWKNLIKVMNLSFENEEILTNGPSIDIIFNQEAKTKSKKPKLLLEKKTGELNGYTFDYWELNIGALIEYNIIEKNTIKKDYSTLF